MSEATVELVANLPVPKVIPELPLAVKVTGSLATNAVDDDAVTVKVPVVSAVGTGYDRVEEFVVLKDAVPPEVVVAPATLAIAIGSAAAASKAPAARAFTKWR